MDNNDLSNLINLLSLVVGLQNLEENREQTEHNDVQKANDKQAKYLLDKLNQKFGEQNDMLKKILALLEKGGK